MLEHMYRYYQGATDTTDTAFLLYGLVSYN